MIMTTNKSTQLFSPSPVAPLKYYTTMLGRPLKCIRGSSTTSTAEELPHDQLCSTELPQVSSTKAAPWTVGGPQAGLPLSALHCCLPGSIAQPGSAACSLALQPAAWTSRETKAHRPVVASPPTPTQGCAALSSLQPGSAGEHNLTQHWWPTHPECAHPCRAALHIAACSLDQLGSTSPPTLRAPLCCPRRSCLP